MDRPQDAHAPRPTDRYGFGPFLIYAFLSVLFFGRALLLHPAQRYLGAGADPGQFMWYLRWWPYALAHHLNPFMPRVIWPPTGVNIAWSASMPLPSLLAAPLTATLGLIPTFNLLCLLSPSLAGWSAFVLCRTITRAWWPALFGGFIFAFSAHMVGKTFGNLNDALVFPIPLIAWLGLLRVNERVSARRFVLMLAVLLAVQFLCFIELFATLTMAAGLTLLLAISGAPQATRQRLLALIPAVIVSYVLATLIVSPYLYFLLAHRPRQTEIMSAAAYSIDLFNFFVPTPLNELGKLAAARALTTRFRCSLVECGGYVGLPLIVIAVLFGRRYRRVPGGRVLLDLLLLLLVLALGPYLQVGGDTTWIGLPWLVVSKLPFIQKALPSRLMLFVFLDLAVMASWWLSEVPLRAGLRIAIAGLTTLFLLPNLAASYWVTDANIPPFFTAAPDHRYLAPGANVIILPYGFYGDAMLWQATAKMRFNMVQGWTGWPLTPAQFENWPIVTSLLRNVDLPDAAAQLKAFLADYRVDTVIVAEDCACVWRADRSDSGPQWWVRATVSPDDRELWRGWMATLGVTPVAAGGVLLYRVPLEQLAPYRQLDPQRLQSADAQQRFDVLVQAAAQYVRDGLPLGQLTPLRAAHLKLLPWSWVGDDFMAPHPEKQPLLNHLLLTRWENTEDVAVGVIAAYAALRPVVEKYGRAASAIHYLSIDQPVRVLRNPDVAGPILLVLTFSRAALEGLATGSQPSVDHR